MFCVEGANVVLVDLNEEKGNTITGELGKQSVFVKADVTSEGLH